MTEDKALVERLGAQKNNQLNAIEAMARIEQLTAEVERLREALGKISKGNTSGFPGIDEGINETFARELMACRQVARAALEGKQ